MGESLVTKEWDALLRVSWLNCGSKELLSLRFHPQKEIPKEKRERTTTPCKTKYAKSIR